MSFDGKEGGPESLSTAATWTKNYRTNNQGATNAHFFGKDILNDILNQPGCMGIRIFYGEKKGGEQRLILVGADANENDMIGKGSIIANASILCPAHCGTANVLNSNG